MALRLHALRAGVETVFGYPGGAIMPIHDALYDGGVEHLFDETRAGGAAMAAIGYAPMRPGKTGVCMTPSGPGATNLITGLTYALLDSVPVVAITGQWPLRSSAPMLSRKWMCSVYRLPAPNTASSFSLFEELPRVMAEAFEVANSGRPGPVLVDIPRRYSRILGDLNRTSPPLKATCFPCGG